MHKSYEANAPGRLGFSLMSDFNFIDNLDGNTMVAALRRLLGADAKGVGARNSEDEVTTGTDGSVRTGNSQIEEARIATAYFSPDGFAKIAPVIAYVPSIKLLLGSDPMADNERWQRKLEETERQFTARKLRENLNRQKENLCEERNHIPFTRNASDAMRRLVGALREGNMQVRRYEQNFLHAKAYIFTPANGGGEYGTSEAVIAGSSNLTASGLTKNLELNLGRSDPPTVVRACAWFDRLWDEAVDFDLAALFEDVFLPKEPFDIFLRVLWELYGDEVSEDAKVDDNLPLTTFQQHGVVRALRLIKEIGGVIVADEVGLGKTFIAGEILLHYRKDGWRGLLICPAALRDTAWAKFYDDHHLYLETVSFEELASDKQLKDEKRRPNAKRKKLKRDIEDYKLIIIDEAHNYRNPDSPHRADALRSLLYGSRKHVLMLTATPVNNSLWDIYHLIRFFQKQDSFLASKGILSIRERFKYAMKVNPTNLSPDMLYPIVDATTVKRTRHFIKKHYSNDQIKTTDGGMQTIVFPEPKAISVRYKLDRLQPGLFDLIESYFDPQSDDCISFARYKTKTYLKDPDPDDERIAHAVAGLLLSGLLKRFESSTGAFRISIERLIDQHTTFLRALARKKVVFSEFFDDLLGTDDEDFEEILAGSDYTADAADYDVPRLRKDVKSDLSKLEEIYTLIKDIGQGDDPKIRVLITELEKIHRQAENDGNNRKERTDNRKVIIFTFFADSARWVHEYVKQAVAGNPKLKRYKGRVGMVVGKAHKAAEEDKAEAASRFAPDTAGGDEDAVDILISTDVLAEGVNLQQARHIINYDMPWNPMRLVQRHGRIDRIGSKHSRVFMRTIFPDDRLNNLLQLEERIAHKIAMAAVSVGVDSPIAGVAGAKRDFTETREEIQKLLKEDASFYEHGGTSAIAQSGEEYRHTLREELNSRRDDIINMPWKAGSGMKKGKEQGIFFCAKVGDRTYPRFVHADKKWQTIYETDETGEKNPVIDSELGRCLRVIECSKEDKLVMNDTIQDAAYDLWLVARQDIYNAWMWETDPANLQPTVRPLNRTVADFIRDNMPKDISKKRVDEALDILESPWSRRDENRLREWFNSEAQEQGSKKAKYLIEEIHKSGLEPFRAPPLLSPIVKDDIRLLVWMGIVSETE